MLDSSAQGVYVIAPTPFHDDGRVDDASIDRMTDFFVEAGCTGITALGMMGEAPKLDGEEARAIASRIIKRAGNTPVVIGVSAPGFAAMRTPLALGDGCGRRRGDDRTAFLAQDG